VSKPFARILAGAACWAVLGATPARAQEAPAGAPEAKLLPVEAPEAQEPVPGADDRQDLDTLRVRYRPAIHPGDPLHLVGNDSEGNVLRAKTPALARGEHDPALVDTDANYQRALAMYGDGKLFHTPLPRAPGTEPAPPTPRLNSHRSAPKSTPIVEDAVPRERGPAAAPWSVLAGLLVSGLLLAWFFVRVRPSLLAPKEVAEPDPQPFVWNPTRRAKPSLELAQREPESPLPRAAAARTTGARTTTRPKPR
jgi:hypothetical protein